MRVWATVCIKMPLGIDVGLSPGHIVLDGDLAPPKKGTTPNFRPISFVGKRLDGSKRHLVGRYRPRPRWHCVTVHGDPAPRHFLAQVYCRL